MKVSKNSNINEGGPSFGGVAVKPQSVKNTLGRGGGHFTPGFLPLGGFQGMWVFTDSEDTKNSPTTKPERKTNIFGGK
jgi:hypothetical protein